MDVAVQKLKVVQVRAAAKDYRDVAALLRNGVSLESGIAAAKVLYPEFSPSVALRALTFFDDGDLSIVPKEDRTVLTQAVKHVRELPAIARKHHRLDAG